jgi:hypothetical protein
MLLYLRLFAHTIVGEQHWSIDETFDLDRNGAGKRKEFPVGFGFGEDKGLLLGEDLERAADHLGVVAFDIDFDRFDGEAAPGDEGVNGRHLDLDLIARAVA